VPDSTLTMAPTYIDSTYNCDCAVNNNYPNYPPYAFYGYYHNFYYPGWRPGLLFYSGRPYRRGPVFRSSHFVARGGFGKLGTSAAT